MNPSDLPERLARQVSISESGCWIWTGSTQWNGYGSVSWKGARRVAHRVSYELLAGPIPKGLQLDHLCRVRGCVNPQHLEPVTNKENVRRSPLRSKRATRPPCGEDQCPVCRTHLDQSTAYVYADGRLACRECKKAEVRAAYWQRKAAASVASVAS